MNDIVELARRAGLELTPLQEQYLRVVASGQQVAMDYPRLTGRRTFMERVYALMDEDIGMPHDIVRQVAAKYLPDTTPRRHSVNAEDA